MSNGLQRYSEHHFRRTIPGRIEALRSKLARLLEDFNYVVVDDTPLQAKRNRTRSVWTATVLEYHCRLTIGLRPISESSTLATFDYAVEYLFTKADRQALEREAEAIIALATAESSQTCLSCGTESSEAVRFCRSCGAPVARHKLPAEIEIMRMQSEGSASQQEITLGLIILLLAVAINLPMILGNDSKAHNIGWVLLSIGTLIAASYLWGGLSRLHASLNPKPQDADARLQSPRDRAALPPQPISVTEATTNLMTPPEQARVSTDRTPGTGAVE